MVHLPCILWASLFCSPSIILAEQIAEVAVLLTETQVLLAQLPMPPPPPPPSLLEVAADAQLVSFCTVAGDPAPTMLHKDTKLGDPLADILFCIVFCLSPCKPYHGIAARRAHFCMSTAGDQAFGGDRLPPIDLPPLYYLMLNRSVCCTTWHSWPKSFHKHRSNLSLPVNFKQSNT